MKNVMGNINLAEVQLQREKVVIFFNASLTSYVVRTEKIKPGELNYSSGF
ncbi:hypothetical protein SAMN05444487_10937 [Marininema mesophilum]|uniref:Uncharacterized protein n=1 Tax=Marininema mesophilum TaxID=1048340 RepID=A0A1H2YDC1_9BACL|nr:hypothetical protein SAMN05444487_10937 [Marininema mesophilum]